MAVTVNPPPQLKIPKAFLQDREVREFIKQQNTILFQLWNRTGGNVDFVDSGAEGVAENAESILVNRGLIEDNSLSILDIEEDINDLQLRVAALEYRVYEIVNTTTPLITEPFQTIICKNTSPIEITLDTNAVENDEVNIKRKGASINVIGLIDGLTDININVKNYSMKLVFDGIEWSEI